MNFLSEINAFERWIETNYLPAHSQLLWYKLMMLFNRSGWAEWISVDNSRLMALIQIKREKTVIDIRDNLINVGLIEYKKGKKGTPNKYKMIFFTFKTEAQTEVYTEVYTEAQTEVKTATYTEDIKKEKEEDKEEERREIDCTEPEQAVSAPASIITLTLNDKTEYPIHQEDINYWGNIYPAVNIMQELRKMKGWCNASPAKRKTKTGIKRFINTWLAKEQDKGGDQLGRSIRTTKTTENDDFFNLLEQSAKGNCK